jgi:hypothetical protein
MYKRFKQKLIYWLAVNLLPIVNKDDIISFKKDKVFVGGTELTPVEIHNLKVEAMTIKEMRLWQIIVNDLNEKTQKKIYQEAVGITDLVVGKTILYTLDVQKNFIEKLKD